jgi:hypothetical protein
MLDPGEYSRTRNNILNRPSGIQKKSCYSIYGVEQSAFELIQLHPDNASCIQRRVPVPEQKHSVSRRKYAVSTKGYSVSGLMHGLSRMKDIRHKNITETRYLD